MCIQLTFIEDLIWWRQDMNFMLEWQEQNVTNES